MTLSYKEEGNIILVDSNNQYKELYQTVKAHYNKSYVGVFRSIKNYFVSEDGPKPFKM